MSLRPSCDPLGGKIPLVDKMIGNAYDTVAIVARNIQTLLYIANNMTMLAQVHSDLKTNTTVFGIAGQLGQTVPIPLPDTILPERINSSSIILDDGRGGLFSADSGYFISHIENGVLHFTLMLQAPPALVGASIRWFLTHGG